MSGAAEAKAPVTVPDPVYEGLEFVRDSGETNMAAYNTVMRLAHDNGFHATVTWMDENKEEYYQGFMNGFNPESEVGDG